MEVKGGFNWRVLNYHWMFKWCIQVDGQVGGGWYIEKRSG